MKKLGFVIFILAVFNSAVIADDQPVPVTHWDFQAIYSDGTSSFDDVGPWQVVLEGIILNNPENWLDPTPDPTLAPWYMGGEWQIFIQGEGDDHAGTACYMAQNYGNGPGDFSYTNQEWLDEIYRLNRDPDTGYIFHAGDRVRVTGTYLFYGGKLNINENHEIDPEFDFTIELVKPAVGLPQPEEIAICDLKYPDNSEIFDATRMTGCEYYQGIRVRIEDVNIIDPNNWAPDGTVTIQDANGLTFPVTLQIGSGISRYQCPAGQIDVIGVINQEPKGYPVDPTSDYEIVVFDYDGNGLVLGDTGSPRGNLPGDVNTDYIINFDDIARLAENWLKDAAGLYSGGI